MATSHVGPAALMIFISYSLTNFFVCFARLALCRTRRLADGFTFWNQQSPVALDVANYLRSKEAKLRVKDGIMDGRRVEVFKGRAGQFGANAKRNQRFGDAQTRSCLAGKSALKAIQLPVYNNPKRPAVDSAETAAEVLGLLLAEGLFVRVEKTKSRHYRLVPTQNFNADGYFVWIYQGPLWKTYLIGGGLIAIVLAGVMFPLWPVQLRTGVWYLSVSLLGLLGVFFAMVFVRFLIYIATVLIYRGQGLWIFPNLFEDVGILESFQPYYAWELSK